MTTSAELPLRTVADRSASPQPGTPEELPAVSVPPLASGMGDPSADCIADSAGGLTFDLPDAGPPGAPDTWDAALLLRRRSGDTAAVEEVRLPLVHAGDGRLRAVLPSTVTLPEGRWDVCTAMGGSPEGERLAPGLLDLRSLVDRRPDVDRSSVAVRIPYATKHGNLSVRSWLRAPHAEAGEIRLSDGTMTVQGRLYGAQAGPDATVEARCRRDPSQALTMPVSVEGAARSGGADRHFAFTLSYKELAENWQGVREPWDLWLRPAAGAETARIARILDDVPDRKHIFSYPGQALSTPYGPAEVGPYYTKDNDLAVRIDPAG
ncbi:hypothetical protein ABZW18_07825 [Streptomyces sp. NPDC004647]|uniref:hypothetical protein n=1 Tax=Streptomyces sp. NPDC004647 TaxID=3154671 RepID=UPI0033ADA27A